MFIAGGCTVLLLEYTAFAKEAFKAICGSPAPEAVICGLYVPPRVVFKAPEYVGVQDAPTDAPHAVFPVMFGNKQKPLSRG